MLLWKCTLEVADHVDLNLTKYDYTKSLVNADSFYVNFTNTTFQKEPRYMYLMQIPSLTRLDNREVPVLLRTLVKDLLMQVRIWWKSLFTIWIHFISQVAVPNNTRCTPCTSNNHSSSKRATLSMCLRSVISVLSLATSGQLPSQWISHKVRPAQYY